MSLKPLVRMPPLNEFGKLTPNWTLSLQPLPAILIAVGLLI
jgi:hypothetical protein